MTRPTFISSPYLTHRSWSSLWITAEWPQAAQFQHGLGILEALLFILADKVSQHGGQLLQAQRILAGRLRQRGQQDLGACRHVYPGVFRDLSAGWPTTAELTAILSRLITYFVTSSVSSGIQEITVVFLHDFFKAVFDFPIHDNRLFRSTDHAVVKGFGDNQVGAGPLQVYIFIDIAGHVSRPHAQRGFSGAVSGLDHAGAAPVAKMSDTPRWFIKAEVASSEGVSIHWIQYSGAPALMAASRRIRAASAEHF